MSTFRFAVPITLAFALPITVGHAQETTKPPARVAAQGEQAPKETWVVAQIGDQLEVLKTSDVEATKKKLEADHKAAVAKHREAVKAAEAKHAKFDQPVPAAQMLTVVASNLKTAADAEAQLKKLRAEQEAKAKAEKEKAKGSETGRKGDGKKN